MFRWHLNRRELLKWAAASSLVPGRRTRAQTRDTNFAPLRADLQGLVVDKSDPGFPALRESMAWNRRVQHSRSPEAIVQARSVEDVSAAVKFARDRNLKVAVRGGGHNYFGASVRDGGLLIDLSRLNRIAPDVRSRRASVQPGCTGGELAALLAELGLAFPVGHCAEVPLSGYLLAGGFGWNVGEWGPACSSVRGIELVTAEGEIVRADARQNADLFWAARGAGPGFFGVVTSFDLEVYEQPRAIRMHSTAFDPSSAPAAAAWFDELVRGVHPSVEIIASYSRDLGNQPGFAVSAFAFAADDATARERLAPFATRPAELVPLAEPVDLAVGLPELFAATSLGFPKHRRMHGDMRWSNASLGTLLTELRPLAAKLPPAPSALVMVSFAGKQPPNFLDTALSVGGTGFVGAYSFWETAEQDAVHRGLAQSAMDAVAAHASGSYVGEADLTTNPNRVRECFSPEAWTRLNALKAQHDPSDLFFSYLTEP